MVVGGLRIHLCPKVATTSIARAYEHLEFCYEYPEDAGPEYRFMPVRHPLDRMVSAWAFFCHGGKQALRGQPELQAIGCYDGMPFAKFAELCLVHHECNIATRMQTKYRGPHKIDEFCPSENLDQRWPSLRDKFPFLRPLRWANSSNHDRWLSYFTPDLMTRSEKVFADDMALYETSLTETANEHDDARIFLQPEAPPRS